MTAWVAAVLAAYAVWWCFPSPRHGLGRLRASNAAGVEGHARGEAGKWALVAVGMVLGSALLGGPRAAACALAGVQVVAVAAVLARRRRARVGRVRRRAEVVHAGELIAGLLRVGRVPSAAMVEAAADARVLRVPAAELRAGGEPAGALRRSARLPGLEGLGDLASAWEVSVRTGASLVEAVDAASLRLSADAEVARVVEAELSAARLAGRVMAVLPLAGLGLGYGLGGDPLAFLTGAPLGWICLNTGVALGCAGVMWIDAVAQGSGGR